MMPTNEELHAAIEAAQAAGDKEAVQILQGELAKSRPSEEVQTEYDALPWYKQLGTAIGDDARLVTKGATFGWSPEIIAGVHSMLGGEGDYDTNVAEIQNRNAEAAVRAGSAAIPAEILGGLRSGKFAYGLSSIPERAIAPMASAAMKYLPMGKVAKGPLGTAGSVLTSGAAGGAAIGGLEAGAQGESVPEGAVKGAVEGGLANLVAGPLSKAGGWLVGKGVENTIGGKTSQAAIDYIKEAAKKAGYDIEDSVSALGVLSAEKVKEQQRKKYRPTKY